MWRVNVIRKIIKVMYTIIFVLSALLVSGKDSFAASSVNLLSGTIPLDLVLVIDASESMTYGASREDPMYDPAQCNSVNDCHPFKEIKTAATSLVDRLNFHADRVAVVKFDDDANTELNFSSNKGDILAAISDLEVVEPHVCPTDSGPCRNYERYPDDDPIYGNNNGYPFDEPIIDLDGDGFGDKYLGFDCPIYRLTGDPSSCPTTAIGQGLLFAGNEFANDIAPREDALQVVILISDGAANAPSFVCPNNTWTYPFCRDLSLTRYCLHDDDSFCLAAGGVYWPERYDSDDYARDMADSIVQDQEILIYTIGLGNLVRTSEPRIKLDAEGDPTDVKCDDSDPLDACWGAGEQLLRYAAAVSGGNYYFAPTGEQLEEIFLEILSHISPVPGTLVVNKTDDTNDGTCDSDCSLREAIAVATSGSTINFASSLEGQTIFVGSSLILEKDLTIDGSALGSHIQVSGDSDEDGTGDVPVFRIPTGRTVEIIDLDIVKGNYIAPLTGGGINNYGNLTISNCSFSGNRGDQGGAIHNKGSLTVSGCSFTNNTAIEGGAILNDVEGIAAVALSTFINNTTTIKGDLGGGAGAVANVGALSVVDSIFDNNFAQGGGGALVNSLLGSAHVQGSTFMSNSTPGFGGAIYNYSGSLEITNSTFSFNSAGLGAAINAGNKDPYTGMTEGDSTLAIQNSTFFGNTAETVAGGLHVFSGTAIIIGSTFNNNTAEEGSGIVNIEGAVDVRSSTFYNNASSLEPGGVIVNAGSGSLSVNNSTISDNVGGSLYNLLLGSLSLQNTILANSASGVDCYNEGTLTAAINNLIEVNGSGDFACGTPALADDPLLGQLDDNGGPTQTLALLSGSPAIDAGDDNTCESTDQRGVVLPQGAHCDIGAFEHQVLKVTKTADTNDGVCDSDCSLREAVATAFPGSTISFTSSLSGQTISLLAGLTIDKGLTIDGSSLSSNIKLDGTSTIQDIVGIVDGNYVVTIRSLDFINAQYGIFHGGSLGTLNVEDCLFSGNGTGIQGGNQLIIKNSVFDENLTGIYNFGVIHVENSNFLNNNRGLVNEKVLIYPGDTTIVDSTFAHNSQGGIRNQNGTLSVISTNFIANESDFGGGIISIGTARVSNSEFTNNVATQNGGGIVNGGNLILTSSTFSGNTSANSGGGIFSNGGLEVFNSTFVNNDADGFGGGYLLALIRR
jgi:CSLREA domain-containing protein